MKEGPITFGTNDTNRNIDVASAPTRFGVLLDRMFNDAPNALVVVAKITPTPDAGANAIVQAYNNAIASVVQTRAANGRHVTMVDMYGTWSWATSGVLIHSRARRNSRLPSSNGLRTDTAPHSLLH